ncbi:autotransporter domain-containing protein [Henriciella litoralis]|uniref:autotransporter domain-containing protein n=1 Tax=Henriciella litoralis TaxID=568102 RepID=UPI00146C3847|nr:autotransporter domain-containing protein [Henriciella litoralis]
MKIRKNTTISRSQLLLTVGAAALISVAFAPTASAIVPNDNVTPDEAVDTEGGVNGVGMFYRADGFVCTGTLINPRTVLFAAHCVNNYPQEVFGSQLPAAFSFDVDALPGFIDWINNGYASNPAAFVYNVSQIQYHPDSLKNPQSQGFLEADIALATLDTPAADIPTWALLFSALPTPTQDPVNGTGYHVNITGYGRSGNGTQGDIQGIDWRRRAAENMLGALTSFDARDEFLFGSASGLPQDLYHLDFDDPNKTNPYDFNLYQDEPLANEATTAGGDSGGPLILDAANNDITDEDLVIGVLSGGSRFFGGQVFSSYGTQSFYQPLYLFYDYIAEVNPYRYVSALEGDGNWEDASHWVSELDPNYRIIDADGNIVNGFPDEPAAGIAGTDDDFGVVCFDPEGDNVGDACQDLSTGDPVDPARPGPTVDDEEEQSTETVSNNIGRVSLGDLLNSDGFEGINFTANSAATTDEAAASAGAATGVEFADNAPQVDAALPPATIDNGLPGATDFVPDNQDPDAAAGVRGKYFDVTLSRAGTTTLSSSVEIDRFTLSGAEAGLNITSDGALTSLIDVTQAGGLMNVDGSLTSVGDYLLMMGILSGNGTVTTPFLTNVAGGIAPGTPGTIGELTIDGSLVLSSGSALLMDVSADGSDTLNVTGDASLGGIIALGYLDGGPAFGQEYSLVNIDGDVDGDFAGVTGVGDGVLFGDISINDGAVTVSVEAQAYQDFLGADATEVQKSYARTLDAARSGSYDDLSGLYGAVDLLAAADVATAFDLISPDDAIASGQVALSMGEALSNRLDSRLRDVRNGKRGFTTTAPANAVDVAASNSQSAFAAAASQLAATESEVETKTYDMKPGFGGFLNVDFFTGQFETAFTGRGDTDVEGFTVTGGFDQQFENGAVLGIFGSYAEAESDLNNAIGSADADGGSVGVYGSAPFAFEGFVDGYASLGSYSYDMRRDVTIPGGTSYSAAGETDADQMMIGASVGKVFTHSSGVASFTPSLSIDHLSVDFDAYTETGGPIALAVDGRTVSSTQVSFGGVADWNATESGRVRLNAGAFGVYDLNSDEDVVVGTFAAAPTTGSIVLTGQDPDDFWVEVQAGLDVDLSSSIVGSLNVKQTLSRDDLEQTTIGGSLTVKF